MEPFDFYLTIIELGITKTEISSKLNVKRPTLDKAISQYIDNNRCNNPRIMILFSRLQKYEFLTKKIVYDEIDTSLEFMSELNNRFDQMCQGNDILAQFNDTEENDNNTENIKYVNDEKNMVIKQQRDKPIRGKSKKNPKHKVGQKVKCTIIDKLDNRYLVRFDHVKGTIPYDDFPELLDGQEIDSDVAYMAKINRIIGTHYYLRRIN